MWMVPDKYKIDLPNVNQELSLLEGELSEREAKITLCRFLRHNLCFTVQLLTGIRLAEYQEILLKGMFNRDFSMLVAGRGCGKTVDYQGLTYLIEKNRGLILLKDLIPNLDFNTQDEWRDIPEVELWNGDSWQKTSKIYVQPKKKCLKITTKRGYSLIGSTNHLIKSIDVENCKIIWKKYDDFKIGDYAGISRNNIDNWNNKEYSEKELDEAYLIGLILGDGCISKTIRNCHITSADNQILDFCIKMGGWIREKDKVNNAKDAIFSVDFTNSILSRYNIPKGLSYTKEIPNTILSSKPLLKECLSALFDTDGHCDKGRMVMGYCSVSEKMALQVHLSLSSFGIISTLSKRKTNSPFGIAYHVDVSGEDCIKFRNNIGFRLDRKKDILDNHINLNRKLNTNTNIIPGSIEYFKNIKNKYKFHGKESIQWHKFFKKRVGQQISLSYDSAKKYLELFQEANVSEENLNNIKEILDENFFFDPIVSIEEVERDCLDFNIPEGAKYWCNGFINHNSFLAAVFCYLICIFEPNTKVIIAGPTFRTARAIFTELETMVNSKNGILLAQAFGIKASKRNDMFEWKMTNGSSIKAIPLNGEKIRGFRANILLLDEYLLLSEHIVETILTPFLVANKDLTEKLKIVQEEDYLIKKGKMTEDQRTNFENQTKLICFSSASYSFEHLYVKYKEWRNIIESPQVSKSDAKYFIAQLSYQALPEVMINKKIIEQAKNGGSSDASFQREYCAQFTDGSDSYFSAKKMKDCTHEDGNEPTVLVEGRKDKKYILAIDPNMSNSPSADFFAMAVLEMDHETEKVLLVHNYANAGGDLKDHIAYLYYILTHFNIEIIIVDSAGSAQIIQGSTESELFKKAGKSLSYIDYKTSEEGVDYQIMLREIKNQYNKLTGRICIKLPFTSEWIRMANEHLQSYIDRKKLWFASKISSIDYIYDGLVNKKDAEFVNNIKSLGFKDMDDFISEQDTLVSAVKAQCALIEIKTTAQGTQSFDLPMFLRRSQSPDRARKDNYTTLMLGCWCHLIWLDMFKYKPEEINASFEPFIM